MYHWHDTQVINNSWSERCYLSATCSVTCGHGLQIFYDILNIYHSDLAGPEALAHHLQAIYIILSGAKKIRFWLSETFRCKKWCLEHTKITLNTKDDPSIVKIERVM